MHSVVTLLVMRMVFPHGQAAGPQVKNQSHKTQLDSPHGGKPQDRQAGHAHFAADQTSEDVWDLTGQPGAYQDPFG